MVDPNDPNRETVDLLFFPTGGGKTEAYLGLAAFAMVLRRLRNPEAGGRAGAGVSVIMRYTRRLLTLDQLARAAGLVCAPHLAEIGVNLFNFAFDHPIAEMQKLVGENVALLGNIPPRDVLAQGTPDDVRKSVRELLDSVDDTRRIILSCGGGMPPDVTTENIAAFLEAAGYGGGAA